MRRLVIDTNVLISGNLSRLGPPGRIVDRVNDGTLIAVYDARILAEYEAVLRRPRFHFSHEIVEALLENIQRTGSALTARSLSGVILPDQTDLPFLEVAAAGVVDYLVTGNTPHFVPTRGTHAVEVVSPRQYMDLLDRVPDREKR